MKSGPAGSVNLNARLQEAVTPSADDVAERRFGGRVFKVGDKVTQIRNNYEKGENGVFNGTLGVITGIEPVAQEMRVRTDEDEEITYDFAELDELAHAYAITVHRSQGSEYPAVVVPVTTSAWMMLQRNLLYTAVTRAKRLVVLVGSRRALAQAVRNASSGRRHTTLAHRLTDGDRRAGTLSRAPEGRCDPGEDSTIRPPPTRAHKLNAGPWHSAVSSHHQEIESYPCPPLRPSRVLPAEVTSATWPSWPTWTTAKPHSSTPCSGNPGFSVKTRTSTTV